jgi:membrane fusion protein, multidrug efflux system
MRISKFYLIPLLIFIVILSSCDGGPPKFGRNKAEGEEAMPETDMVAGDDVLTVFAVNTTTAVQGQIKNYIEVNGDVETKSSIDAYADTMGKLTKLNIRVGSRVVKDEIIAEVDPSRPGMNFIASPVKSPITGTVVAIPSQIGATIAQGVPIARISRMDELQIRTEVAERFISKMSVGLEALLRFEAYPDERFRARITELSPVVDPNSRTMEVTLKLTSNDKRIKSGMFAEVKIITEEKEGIVKIPSECVVKRFGEYFVFVIKDDGTVERRKVNPGIQIDNKQEITEGLYGGEEVVLQGQTLLEDKARIKVIEKIESLAAEDRIE